MSKYSDAEKKQLLKEVLDSKKVILICQDHFYTGDGPPPETKCAACWTVFYTKELGKAPPHLRQQRLAEMEKIARDMVQDIETGKFDVQIFDTPKIEYNKPD